mgnify:FL=1
MAINFLNSIDFNKNELFNAKIQNEINDAAAGTPVDGQLYYNTTDDKLKVGEGGSWVALQSSGDTNTTYDLTATGSGDGTATVNLVASNPSSTDSILFDGAGTTSVTRSGSTITITSNDQYDGTVTSVSQTHAGNAFNVAGSPVTVSGTLGITMAGTSAQYINGQGNLTTFPSIPQGDITAVNAGLGLQGGGTSGSISLAVDYTGTNNIIDSAADGTTIVAADKILYEDATDSTVKEIAVSSLIALAPQGDITNVSTTSPITGGGSSGSVNISHASQADTGTTDTASLSFGGTFGAYTGVTTNATGHVTGHEVTTFTLPANPNTNTTYTLPVSAGAANTAVVTLNANSGTDSTVTFSGTTSEISISETVGNNGSITIGLPDDVTIASDLTVGDNVTLTSGNLSVSGTGSFTGQVTIPVTPSAAASAASKSYVDSTLAGSGALIFQGGYNAATNTPDLDVSPSASIKQGWTYAVTAAGNFFGEAVEDGDLLIAESDAPTTLAAWTVVQNNIGVATAGSSDGATTKGIAGFNSAHFNVTSNGWVSSDIYSGGSTLGIVPSGGGSTTFLRGDGSWVTPTNTNTQRAAGTGLSLSGNTINANVDGTQSVAANSSSTTGSRTYKVQVDSGDNLVVNVPWVNTNTQTVTSVDEVAAGTSTGTPIIVNPTTGAVKVQSMAYDGGSDVGHVPAGGGSTTFLRGDGSWVTPSTGSNNYLSALSFNTGNGIITASRQGLSALTVDLDGRYALTSAIPTITAQGDSIFLTGGSTAGGITTFTYNVTSSFSGAVAIDVKCEIVSAAGETVFTEVTRSGTTLTVKFSGTVANSAYKALLTYVG